MAKKNKGAPISGTRVHRPSLLLAILVPVHISLSSHTRCFATTWAANRRARVVSILLINYRTGWTICLLEIPKDAFPSNSAECHRAWVETHKRPTPNKRGHSAPHSVVGGRPLWQSLLVESVMRDIRRAWTACITVPFLVCQTRLSPNPITSICWPGVRRHIRMLWICCATSCTTILHNTLYNKSPNKSK